MATKADLVDEVKDLQRSDPAFKGAWTKYADERLSGLRDPNRHDAKALQTFLTLYHQGSLDPAPPEPSVSKAGQWWPSGTEPPKKVVQSPMGMLLVERIKALQRTDEKAKQAWWKFCDMNLSGKKDPSLHDETVLQNFLTSYNMGTLNTEPDVSVAEDGAESQPDLVRKVKYLQRSDANAKQAWWDYCESHLNGKKDPNMHEARQLRDFIAKFKAGSLTVEAGGSSKSGAAQEDLVQKVKGLQRSDDNAKQAWQRFCGGVRDPGRHTAAFLEKFLQSLDPANQQAEQAQQASPPLPAIGFMQPALPMAAIEERPPPPPPEPQVPALQLTASPHEEPPPPGVEAMPVTTPSWGSCAGSCPAAAAPASAPPPLVGDFMSAAVRPRANGGFITGAGGGPKTVAIKKSVTDHVRRLNSAGFLREEIKLGRVAASLSRLDERVASQVLGMLETMSWVEDPNEFIIAQASMMLEAGWANPGS